MVAGGLRSAPQFLSLSPSEYPLPSCLSGTKKKINIGDADRQNPALIHTKGKSMLSIIKKRLEFNASFLTHHVVNAKENEKQH